MIVGAISYNAIQKATQRLQHIPDCLIEKNNPTQQCGFRVSARRKNEIRDHHFKGLVGIDIARTLQGHFGEKVEPDQKAFRGTKSNIVFHVEKMQLLRLAGKQPEKGHSLWVTQETGHTMQYWLTADSLDASAFLKAYILEQKDMDAYAYTLHYVLDERFAPFVTGSAEYGPDRMFNFSKHVVPLPTPQP